MRFPEVSISKYKLTSVTDFDCCVDLFLLCCGNSAPSAVGGVVLEFVFVPMCVVIIVLYLCYLCLTLYHNQCWLVLYY